MTINCELYNINITPYSFKMTPKVQGLQEIEIQSNGEEDFSIFELGPAIADNVIMQANSCSIGQLIYHDICLEVVQHGGTWMTVTIREGRANHDDPVNSGRVLFTIKDYVIKFE